MSRSDQYAEAARRVVARGGSDPEVTAPSRRPGYDVSLDGYVRDGKHHMQVRVYYEDTDFSDPPLL